MAEWDGKTRGTLLGYRIFIFFIRYFGPGVAYFFLEYLVAPYYFLFVSGPRKVLNGFYRRALGLDKRQANRLALRNFRVFGQTLIDRMVFLVGKGAKFQLSFEHEDYLIAMKEGGKGGILLSAHLGNWEMAGNLLKGRVTPTINIVMLDAELAHIKQYLDRSTGGSRFHVIPIRDDLSHVIKIRNALAQNEFVAIHADRLLDGAKSVELPFFGIPAKFPLGPFIIAAKFDAPVTFVFGVKEAGYRYFLSATRPVTGKRKPEEIAALYVQELENRVRRNPEQWFNYFNFFSR